MFKTFITAATLTLSVVSVSASAFVIESQARIAGIVTDVDSATKTFSIKTSEGVEHALSVNNGTRIKLDNGQAYDLEQLSAGNSVKVKLNKVEAVTQAISGKLLSVNKAERRLTIREQDSNKIVQVLLSDSTRFDGAADSINGLERGQTLVLRNLPN